MPGQRHKDRRGLLIYITHEHYAKFAKKAGLLGMTMSEILTAYIIKLTRDIQLTPEDYEDIARRIRKKEGRPPQS